VSVSPSTGYHFSAPGVNFGNLTPDPTYLAVGQRVMAAATYVPPPSTTSGTASSTSTTATAADIYIPLQTLQGNYVSLLAVGSDNLTGGFLLTPCSGFYQGQPIYVITNGQPGNNQSTVTQFVNLNGLAGLSPPPELLVRGLLFLDQAGGTLNGIIGDPAQIDAMYAMGFARLAANNLPYPTFGAFTGYSTAYNTSYSNDGLYSNNYRDLPITSYAWQIETTTGGPNAWWEANGSGPNASNPWAGNHAPPEFGACPYAWPLAGQTLALVRSRSMN